MRAYRFPMLNRPIDVSEPFRNLENTLFIADSAAEFDPESAQGRILWKRHQRKLRLAFGEVTAPWEEAASWSFPPEVYAEEPELPFSLSFIGERTIRLRIAARERHQPDEPSLMLVNEPPSGLGDWEASPTETGAVYRGKAGSVAVHRDPFRIEIRDAQGRPVTATHNLGDGNSLINSDLVPLSFVRMSGDMSRRIAASFSLKPDEKIYGCGESFTRLNKRGQRLAIMTNDAHSAQTAEMYKPVPFFLTSAGYGVFAHTSAPLVFDFGHSYDKANVIYSGDDRLDLFIFLGEPKEILEAYTALTGRSPLPPLWSFGLWMSRITYKSEAEAREVAAKLRQERIPCDVIHLDTGWFERDWCCDYQFSTSRFDDPEKMIADLKAQGFRISLWQLPYFTPANRLYQEAIEKGYVVLGPNGEPPTDDAVIDFSNPEAVRWYQGLLAGLLKMGVAAIKVDFGEASPHHGLYASGKTGFYEHNLYPLRYNKAAFEITREITGESIIWARSAWAGSQRYPLHWGGDAENTDSAMAATLRAGLSFGLCGFSFWSHDIGGFVRPTPPDLYRRWGAFGLLTSHSRLHGAPPKEPWAFGPEVLEEFRKTVELKYRLMPYVYAEAAAASAKGHPMLRPLFFEFPEDPTSWFIEDQYLFGRDLLAAPLLEEGTSGRNVYLPPGGWVDYQCGRYYPGARWHYIEAGEAPIVLLVREGAAVPHIGLAQHTGEMDWSRIEWVIYGGKECNRARGRLRLPDDERLHEFTFRRTGAGFEREADPLAGKVRSDVTHTEAGD